MTVIFPLRSLLLVLGVLAPLGAGIAGQVGSVRQEPAPARRAELVRLVRQDCGSCHGMTLNGGLGPALRPADLADKPLDSMVATIMSGRPGTAMPGWSRFLSEGEARWIVEALSRGFPELPEQDR